jgi:hypothetical protein
MKILDQGFFVGSRISFSFLAKHVLFLSQQGFFSPGFLSVPRKMCGTYLFRLPCSRIVDVIWLYWFFIGLSSIRTQSILTCRICSWSCWNCPHDPVWAALCDIKIVSPIVLKLRIWMNERAFITFFKTRSHCYKSCQQHLRLSTCD